MRRASLVALAHGGGQLAEFGVALTNLCARPVSGRGAHARRFEAGRRELAAKCERMHPGVVAFVGLSLYQAYFSLKRAAARAPSRRPSPAGARIRGAEPERLMRVPGFCEKAVCTELRDFVGGAAVRG